MYQKLPSMLHDSSERTLREQFCPIPVKNRAIECQKNAVPLQRDFIIAMPDEASTRNRLKLLNS